MSYIFCNIHREMSAIAVVVSSPHFAVAGESGEFSILDVPPRRYMFHVWSEDSLPEALQALSHEVELDGTTHSVGNIASSRGRNREDPAQKQARAGLPATVTQ